MDGILGSSCVNWTPPPGLFFVGQIPCNRCVMRQFQELAKKLFEGLQSVEPESYLANFQDLMAKPSDVLKAVNLELSRAF